MLELAWITLRVISVILFVGLLPLIAFNLFNIYFDSEGEDICTDNKGYKNDDKAIKYIYIMLITPFNGDYKAAGDLEPEMKKHIKLSRIFLVVLLVFRVWGLSGQN